MSDISIRITEKQIVDAMDEMCRERLGTELYAAWEKIVVSIAKERIGPADCWQEIFPGTLDALNKITLYGA